MFWQPYAARHRLTVKPSGPAAKSLILQKKELTIGRTAHLGGATGSVYIQRLLGRGAYGAVYAVEAQHYRGGHVLKCVDLSLQSRRTVAHEVALQRKAAGTYVIEARTPTFSARHAYFLLERGHHGTVEEVLTRNLACGRPTELHLILKWFQHMVQAVGQCHQRGIVHRDIKADNFVLVGGETVAQSQAKLTDFGLATTLINPPHTVGTLTYMAPEVLRGEGATAAADLWSLGTTLYRMIVGIEPFYDETAEAIAARLLRNEPQFDRSDLIHTLLGRRAPPPLWHAIVQAVTGLMQPDPARRFGLSELAASALGNEIFLVHHDGTPSKSSGLL